MAIRHSCCCDWRSYLSTDEPTPDTVIFGERARFDIAAEAVSKFEVNPFEPVFTQSAVDSNIVTDGTDFFAVGWDGTTYDTLSKYNSSFVEQWKKSGVDWYGVDVDDTYVYSVRFYDNGELGSGYELVKFNKSGTEQWAADLTVSGFDALDCQITSVSVDDSGNTVVTGYHDDGDTFTIGDSFPVIWYFDSTGAEQWDAHGGAGSPGDREYQSAECSCFDSSGNVYIGYGIGWARNYRSMFELPPTGSYNWIQKYNSSGTLQWTKNQSHTTGYPYVGQMRVGALEIAPDALSNTLLVTENTITNNTNPVGFTRVKQYSGASHGTEDFNTFSDSTPLTGSLLYNRRLQDRGYFAYAEDGTIYGGERNKNKINSSGTILSAWSGSSANSIVRTATSKGRHPNFI